MFRGFVFRVCKYNMWKICHKNVYIVWVAIRALTEGKINGRSIHVVGLGSMAQGSRGPEGMPFITLQPLISRRDHNSFALIQFHHVYQEQNRELDKLFKLACNWESGSISLRVYWDGIREILPLRSFDLWLDGQIVDMWIVMRTDNRGLSLFLNRGQGLRLD